MATIKLKFRPSTVRGKAGTLCYQLCHRQENRQITTDMRIFPEWWDETRRRLVTLPGNEEIITGYHKRTEREMRIVREIIRELDLSVSPALALSRDLFVFGYCARGMTFVDMAYLRKENVSEGRFTYRRHKTGQRLTIRVEPCMEAILKLYTRARPESPYVFPILTDTDPERAYRQYRTGLNYHNRKLKRLGGLLGIPLPCPPIRRATAGPPPRVTVACHWLSSAREWDIAAKRLRLFIWILWTMP